jgi:hypothetical protein
MSYGLRGACETASSTNNSTDGDYHPYHSHYNSSIRSQSPLRPYSNGYHNSLILNDHNKLNGTQDEQAIEDDYQENAPDRPKLLMWGLTKYL